jgi:hypothetical protein
VTTFKEQMAADLDVFFNLDEFAEMVSYSDGTNTTSVKGILDFGGTEFDKQASTGKITVKKSDVPSPGYRHTFTIDGETWTVKADKSGLDISGEGLTWEIGIVKKERFGAWRT